MMSRLPRAGFLLVLLVLAAGVSIAQDAAALLRASRLFGEGDWLSLELSMRVDEGGSAKERKLTLRLARTGEDSRIFAAISSPAFLSKLAFLRLSEGASQRQWLRTSSGVKRLAEGSGGERLFGSDFTVADFSDPLPPGARASAAGGGAPGEVLVVVADSAATRRYRIAAADSLVLGVDYLDGAGLPLRRYEVLETMERAGRRYPKKARMETFASKSSTLLEILSVDDSTPIPARVFNPASL